MQFYSRLAKPTQYKGIGHHSSFDHAISSMLLWIALKWNSTPGPVHQMFLLRIFEEPLILTGKGSSFMRGTKFENFDFTEITYFVLESSRYYIYISSDERKQRWVGASP